MQRYVLFMSKLFKGEKVKKREFDVNNYLARFSMCLFTPAAMCTVPRDIYKGFGEAKSASVLPKVTLWRH